MTVIGTTIDPERLMLALVADFHAAADAVWSVRGPLQARALVGTAAVAGNLHPARLRRQWRIPYHLSGPGGEIHRGFWRLSS